MDSRLLNVFHDDTFDSGYTQLNTDFWSSESDTMGQLTETLHGILPISPDAEPHTDLYSSALLDTEDNFRIANKIDATSNLQNKELLVYGDFTQPQLSTNSIDIITANPNSYDSDSDDDTDYNEDADDDQLGVADIDNTNLGIHIVDFDDNRSHCSDATFRTRTDSSSIGDYESHTSDYDDSSDNDDENVGNITNNHFKDIIPSSATEAILLAEEDIPDLTAGLLETDGIDLDSSFQLHLEDIAVRNKNRSLSTNTIDSDVDVNNFDLAEFITNDEVTLTAPKQKINNVVQPKPSVAPPKHLAIPVKSNIDTDSDVDSDIIVDIETVDVDNEKSLWELASESAAVLNDNDVAYEDNVKKDPSWSPKAAKKDTAPKEVKTRPSTAIAAPSSTTSNNLQNTRNFTIIPSKRQCDILKGKASTGKNKSTTKQVPSKLTTKKGPDATAGNASKAGSLTCRVGVGQSGKNLSLLSQIISADESKPQTNETLKTEEKKSEPIQPTIQDIQVSPEKFQKETALQQTKLAVKRKLNLEEYKRRRGGNAPAGQIECDKTSSKTQTISKSATQNSQVKHSQEVTSVVKSLRNQVGQKPPVDPITDAKNKVLRLQELKRAQQLKMIDSTISAKVPRVTKLPPLKDIVKNTYYADNNGRNQAAADAKLHTDYEELIIVSAGCNTEISIPPLNILPINVCERSLLKSSALLYNMPKGLTSSSSLIASIQDVVVQKVVGPEKSGIANSVTTPLSEKTRIEAEQHGEDKVIMHLRKDRIRPQTVSIGVQTDLQPGFVRLPKIPLKQRAPRNFRKHSGKDDSDSDASCVRSRIRSSSPVNRSRSRSADSYESSVERGGGVRQCDAAGGYSSRSSRRHRSSISSSYSESGCISRATQRQSRTSYKKRTKKYAHNSSVSSSSSSDMSDRSRSRSRSQSRSRSRGHSRSRSRSRSPYYRRSYVKSRSRSRSRSISRASNRFRKPGGHNNFANGNVSQPAVEERRIVYVGRIEEETTKEILRRKFLPYGTIKQISIHYKDTGMKYGFVTYERSQDAFTVIDSSARDPTINMYDISFGGRRAFCRSSYADLDNAGINTYHSVVFPKVQAPPKEEDSFEALLQKVKAKMSANKVGGGTNTIKA